MVTTGLLLLLVWMSALIICKEKRIMVDLSKLTQEVADLTSVVGAASALIQGLSDKLKAIPPSTDPQTQAALDDLTAKLDEQRAALASAVAANTPAQ